MENEIKGVIVDKEYLDKLESLKDVFAYTERSISFCGRSMTIMNRHSKEDYRELINMEVITSILSTVDRKNKERIKKLLDDKKINYDKTN